ncbi:MAG: hypothetical protein E6Q97_18770 [Desulfurellales bacterium]|nr:MAG: hypothetical protein E6Q97_18770 [Desulfurellales bacterium]
MDDSEFERREQELRESAERIEREAAKEAQQQRVHPGSDKRSTWRRGSGPGSTRIPGWRG